jgi:hypothetical protein
MDVQAHRRWALILIHLERDRMALVGPVPRIA